MCTSLSGTTTKLPWSHFHLEQSLAQQIGAVVEQNYAEMAPEQSTTRPVLAELELTYQQAYRHSFTESLCQRPGTGIQKVPSAAEKRA